MEIKNLGVEETSFLHLCDANDELLYEPGPDGKPDLTKPVGITLHSPGTKAYSRASTEKQNRMIDRMKRKGKSEMTPEAAIQDNAKFLTACTKAMHNISVGDLEGEELYMAVYTDVSLGFLADQVMRFMASWGNFTSRSTTT